MKVLKNIKNSLIFGIALMICGSVTAQQKLGLKIPPYKQAEFSYSFKAPQLQLEQSPFHFNNSYLNPYLAPAPFKSPILNDVLTAFAALNQFNAQGMPFFCRIEYQMEQAANFPVRFRLGDVQYVDYLESKRDWELYPANY